MIEQEIEIRMPEGASDGIMYRSQDRRRFPGVIFLTDIGGIRPSQREMAQRLAAEGYTGPRSHRASARPREFRVSRVLRPCGDRGRDHAARVVSPVAGTRRRVVVFALRHTPVRAPLKRVRTTFRRRALRVDCSVAEICVHNIPFL